MAIKNFIYEYVVNIRALRWLFIRTVWKWRFTERLKKSQKNVLFVHIPKTGGTSINSLLPNNSAGHKTLQEVVDAGVYTDQIVFAVVRNPLDKLASFYTYCQNVPNSDHSERYAWKRAHKAMSAYSSFDEFVFDLPTWQKRYAVDLLPQASFITTKEGVPCTLLKFENLHQDFETIRSQFNLPRLPRLNSSTHKKPLEELYTLESLEYVHTVYKADFEYFDYEDSIKNLKQALSQR